MYESSRSEKRLALLRGSIFEQNAPLRSHYGFIGTYHRMRNVDTFAICQRVGGSRWRSKVEVGHVKRALVRGSMRVRGPQKRHFEWNKFQMGVNGKSNKSGN